MAEGGFLRFCLITCLLKRPANYLLFITAYLLERWLYIVEYYLGNYKILCMIFEFWPRLLWLATRTRGYTPAHCSGGDSEVGSPYIDLLLKKMSLRNVNDVYIIENYNKEFALADKFIEIFSLSYMMGLETLHRINDASLKEENGQLELKAELGFRTLSFVYSGYAKLANIFPKICCLLHISHLNFHIDFSVDSETGRNGRLNEFVIYHMGKVHFKIFVFRFTLFNSVLNKIINIAVKIFRRFFHNLIEMEMENHIVQNIRNFQFPLHLNIDTLAEGNIRTYESEPTETTRDRITAEASHEEIADATEHDSDGKYGMIDETAEATGTPEFNTETNEVVDEQIADVIEHHSKEKSETTFEESAEASATQEMNTAAKQMVRAEDPASVQTPEPETSENTLSALSLSSSDSEPTCDISDLD